MFKTIIPFQQLNINMQANEEEGGGEKQARQMEKKEEELNRRLRRLHIIYNYVHVNSNTRKQQQYLNSNTTPNGLKQIKSKLS